MVASSAPAAATASDSVQAQLLANISRQQSLTSQLFALLSHEPGNRAPASSLPTLYAQLVEASDEQAELLERARVQQHRWIRLEGKRARLAELKSGVREVLIGLHEAEEELEGMVREGKEVVESIEAAETARLDPSRITEYAQRLAPYTSRGPTWPPSYLFHAAEGSLCPSAYQMNIGKMRDAAFGMLGGVGERGRMDQAGQEAPSSHAVEGVKPAVGPAVVPAPTGVAPPAAQTAQRPAAPTPAPRAKVPFNLDLDSDSEED